MCQAPGFTEGNELHIWEGASLSEVETVRRGQYNEGVAWSADSTQVAWVLREDSYKGPGTLVIAAARPFEIAREIPVGSETGLGHLAFGTDRICARGAETFRCWSLVTGKRTVSWKPGAIAGVAREKPVGADPFALAPAVHLVLLAAQGGDVLLVDDRTGSVVHRLEGPGSPVMQLAVSADGSLLAATWQSGELRVWGTP